MFAISRDEMVFRRGAAEAERSWRLLGWGCHTTLDLRRDRQVVIRRSLDESDAPVWWYSVSPFEAYASGFCVAADQVRAQEFAEDLAGFLGFTVEDTTPPRSLEG